MSVKGFKKCEPSDINLLFVHYMLIREMDEHSPIKLFNWTLENPEDALSKHTTEKERVQQKLKDLNKVIARPYRK